VVRRAGVSCIEGRTVQLAQLFQVLRTVRSLGEIANALAMPRDETERLLDRLTRAGIVLSGSADQLQRVLSPGSAGAREPHCECLVVGISGTFQVASGMLLGTIARLNGTFARNVHVIMTEGATKFVRPEVISYYGLTVWTDPFEAREDVNVPHMWLATHADVILIAATAHTLHRLAGGACSDLLSLVVSATSAPVVIAPAMNPRMLIHPAVARNIDQLRRDGMYVAEPNLGRELSNTAVGNEFSFGALGLPLDGLERLLSAVIVRQAASAAHSGPVLAARSCPQQEAS
jgi:phosphopantothenoylcysteine decarboxylase/phosphopantothenate--cysteine ligase